MFHIKHTTAFYAARELVGSASGVDNRFDWKAIARKTGVHDSLGRNPTTEPGHEQATLSSPCLTHIAPHGAHGARHCLASFPH